MSEKREKIEQQDQAQRLHRKRSGIGQSIVEMAVAAPILLMILAAIIDMGRAIDAYISMTNGVREGARYGSLHPTDPGTIALRTVNETNGSGVNFTGSASPLRMSVSAIQPAAHTPAIRSG